MRCFVLLNIFIYLYIKTADYVLYLFASRTAPPGYVYAYLSNECAPTMCPGLRSPTRPKSAANVCQPSVPVAKAPFGTHFSGNTGTG